MKRFLLASALAVVSSAMFADSAASFPGGEEAMKSYLSQNMKYPQMALDNGIEGVVDVAFIVKTDGSVGSIKIVRMVDPDLEQEAIRLVKNMPAWNPAEGPSGAMDSPVTIKIDFILPE